MSRAISSVRASRAAAAAVRYAPRLAAGSRDQPSNAAAAAAIAASASAAVEAVNSPTVSSGRIGLTRVYVAPEADGTQAPST